MNATKFLYPTNASDHFSPAGRAAFDEIKQYIQTHVSIAALDERVLILAGWPDDAVVLHILKRVYHEVKELGEELLDGEK